MKSLHKFFFQFFLVAYIFNLKAVAQTNLIASRMGEVFQQTILVSGATSPSGNRLYDPWEITYGPDDSLWVTEAKGYKVKKIHPINGGQRTILNLCDAASGGTFTPTSWRRQFDAAQNPWPQGGMMGFAIHPDYNHPTTPKKYIYIAYVHDYIGLNTTNPNNGESVTGHLFMTRLVRFTYANGTLGSPVSLCDTIVGSNDHNSGRIIIAPVAGTNYLFYAVGDMGAGQFANLSRINKAQTINSYEGKILRFNLEPDGDAGAYDQWIPDDNPFNATLGVQSAVWACGMRNNQGFAYNSETNKMYGSSHGPFSDDELNIIESGKNFGHPLVIGFRADGNYNNAKAGPSASSLPLIGSENTNATNMGVGYQDPIYSFYPAGAGNTSTFWSIQYIYTNQNYTGNPAGSGSPAPTGLAQNVNIHWASEAVSGLDIYTGSLIPGWKNSILAACLKGGRVMRLKLNTAGTSVVSTEGGDTISHFRSVNRFRDIAISPDGKNIFVVIDSSSVTSGPTTNNPMVSACRGCLQRYTFLGYTDNAGVSDISTSIPIGPGLSNSLSNGTTITIDATNNNLWVPITDSLGNILAEIKANGNNLGTVTSTFYIKTGACRTTPGGTPYLNRSITITPQNQPSSAVTVRLYLTAAELSSLISAAGSGVSGINDINIFKNSDANSASLTNTTTLVTPTTRSGFSSDYVITASITSFSSFYFGNDLSTLPLTLISFTGKYINQATQLRWETENEMNTSEFIIERSRDGRIFNQIGIVSAGNRDSRRKTYIFSDKEASIQTSTTFYYRLKMVDGDGTFKYSSIVSILLTDMTGRITIIPNPVTQGNEITLNFIAPANGIVKVKITDNFGRVMMQQVTPVNKGNNNLKLNIDKLPASTYYLHISGTGLEENVKVQKL
jgi:trimeric autotransporter adhesin